MRSEAKQRRVSLNTFVHQVFLQYLDWDLGAPKAKMIPLPKPILVSLIETVSEESIVKMSHDFAKNQNRNTLLMMKNNYDIEAILTTMEAWARAAGFTYRKDYGSKQFYYIINHDMGKNWSLYFKTYFETVFQELGVRVHFNNSDNMLAFGIEID